MQFNDKTNPEVVMVAFLAPRPAHVAIARACGYRPAAPLAVLLNRASHQFHMVEVTQ